MTLPVSRVVRSIEPLTSAIWSLFLAWTAVVAFSWLAGMEITNGISNGGLRSIATLILNVSDSIWLVLAAATLYLHLAETEGLACARIVAVLIATAAGAIAAGNAWTGYPAGSVAYTTRLGMKFGPVPFGWPVLWFVVVVGNQALAARLLPRASHWKLAMVTGGFSLLTDLSLEPVATKLRLFWFWYAAESHLPASPLWRNYATWFIGAAVLAGLIRERKLATWASASWRPALIGIAVNATLVLGHVRSAIAP